MIPFGSSSLRRSLRIMRNNLNLNPHIILPEPRDSNTRPNRLMSRHPLLEIPNHSSQSLVVDGDMVRIHAEDLFPALSSGVLQVQLDIRESLVNLLVDLLVENACFRVPAACDGGFCWLFDHLHQNFARAGFSVDSPSPRSVFGDSLTLSCALDAVADAYGLAVAEFLSLFHADAGVGVVLKMGHVDDCVECNVDAEMGVGLGRAGSRAAMIKSAIEMVEAGTQSI